MSPPANAAAIATVLSEIDGDPGAIATRLQQETLLKQLTSRYRFRYYSSIYGHTCHDERSLRSVLIAIMRHHGKSGEDIRPGKSPVDELFERGSEMLEDEYVHAVRQAAEAVELGADGNSDDSEEDSQVDQELVDFIEAQSDSDDDYTPTAIGRTRSVDKKKGVDAMKCATNTNVRPSYVDSWMEGRPPESSESQSSLLEMERGRSIHGTRSPTPSNKVDKGRKRSRSSTEHFEAGGPNTQSSSKRSRMQRRTTCIARNAMGHGRLLAASSRSNEAEKLRERRHCSEVKGTGQKDQRENLLPIKLLALAAIAALL